MKFAVIILNYFGYKDTFSCIKSVRENFNGQIFLVDNSADSEERKKLKETYNNNTDVSLIFPEENWGFSSGVNLGLKQAIEDGYQRFLLMNNDAVLLPNSSDVFDRAFAKNPGSLIAPTIIWGDSINKGNYYQKYLGAISTTPYFNGLGSLFYFTGCALAFDKKVIDKIGFLDETFFFFGEDVEFCYRAQKNKIPLILLPEPLVQHEGSKSSKVTSLFHEYHLVHSNYCLSFKLIHNPFYLFFAYAGKFLFLFARAVFRCIKYKKLTPLKVFFLAPLTLNVRPDSSRKQK